MPKSLMDGIDTEKPAGKAKKSGKASKSAQNKKLLIAVGLLVVAGAIYAAFTVGRGDGGVPPPPVIPPEERAAMEAEHQRQVQAAQQALQRQAPVEGGAN